MRQRCERTSDAVVPVTAPAVVALILCLIDITARSLWLDEAASVSIATQHGAAFGSAVAHDGGNMLAHYALLHVVIAWFGDGPLAIRLPSALAAAAAAGMLGALALRLFDRRVALASGLLMAVSLPLVYWGQNARGYALMVALVTASFLAFVAVLEAASNGRPGRGAWIAYAVATTLSAYLSFLAVLAVPAQLVVLVWHRKAWPRVLSALAVCIVGWIPLAVLAVRRGSDQLFWVPRPSLGGAKEIVQALSSAGFESDFHVTAIGWVLVASTTVLAVAIATTIAMRVARSGDPGSWWRPTLALSWLVVPTLLVLLESLVGQSVFTPRDLLLCLPAVALLLGWGIVGTSVRPVIAWSVIATLLALRALALAPAYGASPENWRAATSYVVARSRPGDCIAFYPLDSRMPFAYYVRQADAVARAPRPVFPIAPWSSVRPYVERYATPPAAQIAPLPASCPRLWFVSSHEGQANGPPTSRVYHARYEALRVALARRYGYVRTVTFGYASVITVELLERSAGSVGVRIDGGGERRGGSPGRSWAQRRPDERSRTHGHEQRPVQPQKPGESPSAHVAGEHYDGREGGDQQARVRPGVFGRDHQEADADGPDERLDRNLPPAARQQR
jgi:mannosyltransferase